MTATSKCLLGVFQQVLLQNRKSELDVLLFCHISCSVIQTQIFVSTLFFVQRNVPRPGVPKQQVFLCILPYLLCYPRDKSLAIKHLMCGVYKHKLHAYICSIILDSVRFRNSLQLVISRLAVHAYICPYFSPPFMLTR